jgi:DNA-binding NarL/FixJ family response regulator
MKRAGSLDELQRVLALSVPLAGAVMPLNQAEPKPGGAPMTPEIARKVITLFQKTGPPEKLDAQLTPQEVRLLKLLVEGYSYQAAAGQLNISVNTVRAHIRAIYDKLHVHSKSEAVAKALRHRLIY